MVADSSGKGTVVFRVIKHVVTELAHTDITAAAALCGTTGNIYTPREVDDYNRWMQEQCM